MAINNFNEIKEELINKFIRLPRASGKEHRKLIEDIDSILKNLKIYELNKDELTSLLIDERYKITAVVILNIPQEYVDELLLEKFLSTIDGFMEACGFVYEYKKEKVYGSFFQKLLFLTKNPKTISEVSDIYEKGKTALQANYLNKPIAEATSELANASAKLLEASEKYDEIILRIGAILLIKVNFDGTKKSNSRNCLSRNNEQARR